MSGPLDYENHASDGSQVASPDRYRAGALANLSSYKVSGPVIQRTTHYRPSPDMIEAGSGDVEKLSAFYHHKIPRDIAITSLRAGTIKHDVVTFDTSSRSNNQPRTNQIVKQGYTQTYNFIDTGVNQAVIHTQREFFPVPPVVDANKLEKLMTAPTVEAAADLLGLKLPRLVNTGGDRADKPTYSDFEALRGSVVNKAINDDYGMRLANLARLVLHSSVVSAAGMEHQIIGATTSVDVRRIFVAQTPQLAVAELNNGHFAYVGNDEDQEYWAFLMMGLLGVQNNVGNVRSAYSRMVMQSELNSDSTLTYVMQTGDIVPQPATPAAKVAVLNNPIKCLAYYYTYATSMGLAQQASSVLRQVALMPFMYVKTAVLPYKAVIEPKADAYMYLLRQTREDIRLAYNTTDVLLFQSPIVAAAIKAGLAATAFSYRVRAVHRTDEIISSLKGALANDGINLQTMAGVLADYGGITADLEWLSPFSESVDVGLEACIAAYRDYGWLITTYNSMDTFEPFRPAFQTGVDMRNAQFGYSIRNRPYLETLITQSIQGRPWTLESEPLLDAQNPTMQQEARVVSHWVAVIQWYEYVAGVGVTISQIAPTPVSPRNPDMFPRDDGGSDLGPKWKSRRTLSGSEVLPLKLMAKEPPAPSTVTATEEHRQQQRTAVSYASRPSSRSATPTQSVRTVERVEPVPVPAPQGTKWLPDTFAHAAANAELADEQDAPSTVAVLSPPRGRSAEPLGTVVTHQRTQSQTMLGQMAKKVGIGRSRATSRASSTSGNRDSGGVNMGQMLSRGFQQSSEIRSVLTAGEKSLNTLGESIATSDGRMALIERVAPDIDYGQIAEHLTPGGVGTLDINDWVGSTNDGERRHATTVAGKQ